jgi:hypothetical protein
MEQNTLQDISNSPIVSQRNPTENDWYSPNYEGDKEKYKVFVGDIWINSEEPSAFIATGITIDILTSERKVRWTKIA